MEEFDIDLEQDIGTSVSALKNNTINQYYNQTQNKTNVKNTETDIDYDNILENLNNSEINIEPKNENKHKSNYNIKIDIQPKKSINMNQFAKTLETNLENFKNISYNEPLPINLTKNMMGIIQSDNNITKSFTPGSIMEPNKSESVKSNKIINSITKFEYKDILIFILIFILLNNKFVISFIYDYFPYINKINNPYPNLIIRSIMFGFLIYIIKKFNL